MSDLISWLENYRNKQGFKVAVKEEKPKFDLPLAYEEKPKLIEIKPQYTYLPPAPLKRETKPVIFHKEREEKLISYTEPKTPVEKFLNLLGRPQAAEVQLLTGKGVGETKRALAGAPELQYGWEKPIEDFLLSGLSKEDKEKLTTTFTGKIIRYAPTTIGLGLNFVTDPMNLATLGIAGGVKIAGKAGKYLAKTKWMQRFTDWINSEPMQSIEKVVINKPTGNNIFDELLTEKANIYNYDKMSAIEQGREDEKIVNKIAKKYVINKDVARSIIRKTEYKKPLETAKEMTPTERATAYKSPEEAVAHEEMKPIYESPLGALIPERLKAPGKTEAGKVLEEFGKEKYIKPQREIGERELELFKPPETRTEALGLLKYRGKRGLYEKIEELPESEAVNLFKNPEEVKQFIKQKSFYESGIGKTIPERLKAQVETTPLGTAITEAKGKITGIQPRLLESPRVEYSARIITDKGREAIAKKAGFKTYSEYARQGKYTPEDFDKHWLARNTETREMTVDEANKFYKDKYGIELFETNPTVIKAMRTNAYLRVKRDMGFQNEALQKVAIKVDDIKTPLQEGEGLYIREADFSPYIGGNKTSTRLIDISEDLKAKRVVEQVYGEIAQDPNMSQYAQYFPLYKIEKQSANKINGTISLLNDPEMPTKLGKAMDYIRDSYVEWKLGTSEQWLNRNGIGLVAMALRDGLVNPINPIDMAKFGKNLKAGYQFVFKSAPKDTAKMARNWKDISGNAIDYTTANEYAIKKGVYFGFARSVSGKVEDVKKGIESALPLALQRKKVGLYEDIGKLIKIPGAEKVGAGIDILPRPLMALNKINESAFRMGTYYKLLDDGVPMEKAAQQALATFGDFQKIATPLLRAGTRIAPFASWYMEIIPRTIKSAWKNPAFWSKFPIAKRTLESRLERTPEEAGMLESRKLLYPIHLKETNVGALAKYQNIINDKEFQGLKKQYDKGQYDYKTISEYAEKRKLKPEIIYTLLESDLRGTAGITLGGLIPGLGEMSQLTGDPVNFALGLLAEPYKNPIETVMNFIPYFKSKISKTVLSPFQTRAKYFGKTLPIKAKMIPQKAYDFLTSEGIKHIVGGLPGLTTAMERPETTIGQVVGGTLSRKQAIIKEFGIPQFRESPAKNIYYKTNEIEKNINKIYNDIDIIIEDPNKKPEQKIPDLRNIYNELVANLTLKATFRKKTSDDIKEDMKARQGWLQARLERIKKRYEKDLDAISGKEARVLRRLQRILEKTQGRYFD